MTDAVTLQIIRGKLEALAREMGVVLARSAMSPVIYEVYDFGCGISDASGRLIAGSHGVAAFSALFGVQINAIVAKYGDAIRPGDVFMTNDPYLGGSHLNDVLLVVPIFEEGRPIAFASSYAHWTEVGGMAPGSLSPSAEEIYQEGIRFPIMRLYRAGERQDELFELIAANVRLPRMSLGDLNAQIAALRIGETRLREAIAKYGTGPVLAAFDHVLDSSERLARAAVAALPDGVYEAEDFIDGDGFSDTQYPVRMRMTIAGDEIAFDFAGSCDQLRGPMNCSLEMLLCGVKVVFKAIVDPHGPSNEGWYRPLRVTAPEGCVFNARAPAAMGWFYEPMAQGAELVWKAMAPLVPERLTAGSYMSICVVLMGAKRPGSGEQFVHIEASAGGFGAAAGADGTSVLPAAPQGDLYNYSLEPLDPHASLRPQHRGRRRRRALARRLRRDPRIRDPGRRCLRLWRHGAQHRAAVGHGGRRRGLLQRLRGRARRRGGALRALPHGRPRTGRPRAHRDRRRRRLRRSVPAPARGGPGRCSRRLCQRRRCAHGLWRRDRREGRRRSGRDRGLPPRTSRSAWAVSRLISAVPSPTSCSSTRARARSPRPRC